MTLALPDSLLVVPLENSVILPSVVLKISMRGKDATSLSRKHMLSTDQQNPVYIACIPFTSKSTTNESEGAIQLQDKDRLFNYGCVARILRVTRAGLGAFTLFIEGVARFKVKDVYMQENRLHARVSYVSTQEISDTDDDMIRFKALVQEFLSKMQELQMPQSLFQQLTKLLGSVPSSGLADLLMTVIETSFDEKLSMLATLDIKERIEKVSGWMTRQLHVRYMLFFLYFYLFNSCIHLYRCSKYLNRFILV